MIDLNKDLILNPVETCSGEVAIPGSKSISNRVLLIAALSHGVTKIQNLLISEDTQRMLEALKKLGLRIELDQNCDQGYCIVNGCGGVIPKKNAKLFLGNAGTAFRPLTAVLALSSGHYMMSGVDRMHERPIGDLVDSLKQLGAEIKFEGKPGYPPLNIAPGKTNTASEIHINGRVSSQFLTSILIAAPLLKTKLKVLVNGGLVSSPYVSITIKLMRQFGIEVLNKEENIFEIITTHAYSSPGDFIIEGDASNASYFFAAGMLGLGPVKAQGINTDSIQGDIDFIRILRRLGGTAESSGTAVTVQSKLSKSMSSFDLDLNDIPDVAMTLAVLAMFCDGKCYLRNIGSWRVKETDRIVAMGKELRKIGAVVEEFEEELHLTPPDANNIPDEVVFDTYNDHRMAMSLSLLVFLGLRVTIRNPKCVEKTFPRYFDEFCQLVAAPVITIDGPAGSGKGTVAKGVATRLNFQYLDSGALYRIIAFLAMKSNVQADNEDKLVLLAQGLDVQFSTQGVKLDGRIIENEIRTEEVSKNASRIATHPKLRQSLLNFQRAFGLNNPLVADGRDMGTTVFPEAKLKVYLTASPDERARRRYKQLIGKGLDASLHNILEELRGRDQRDETRETAPLKPPKDSRILDSTEKTPKQVIDQIVRWFEEGQV